MASLLQNNCVWHNLLCRLGLWLKLRSQIKTIFHVYNPNMDAKCRRGLFKKLEEEPNLFCRDNTAEGMPCILVFVSIDTRKLDWFTAV